MSDIKVFGTLKQGKNCRIDHGCIFTGNVVLGDYVHIGPYSVFHGGAGITIGSYSGFSAFTSVFTSCSDFSGVTLFGPTIPDDYVVEKTRPVVIGDFVITGVKSSIIVSSVPDGVALGAHSCLMDDAKPWSIYAGVPARRIRDRHRGCIQLARELESRICAVRGL